MENLRADDYSVPSRHRRFTRSQGPGDARPRALAVFAEAHTDQNQREYEALRGAVVTGRPADLPPDTPRPGVRIAHRGERADLHAST